MPYVPTRDLITYYEEAGSGEPLVLIRGLGSDLQAWSLQTPALAQALRVITYDNRGAGRTGAPDKPYSIEGMADDLAALLGELKIAQASILGYSMGGMIAQEFALKYPNKVNKLILLASSAKLDGYSRTVIQNLVEIRQSNLSREQIARVTAPYIYSAKLMDDPLRLENAIQATIDNPYSQLDHAFIRQAQAILAFDTTGRAANIAANTLVVTGEEDTLLPPRNSEALTKLIPGSKLVTLEGGHAGVVEYPHEYNAAFLEFLGAAVPA